VPVLLEGGVVVRGQHFAVGVHVHAGALGLLEEFFHILQVVAGDQDAGVVPHAEIHFADLGIAVGRGVGLVEERHGGNGIGSRLHDHADHIVDGEVFRGRGKGFHDGHVNLVLLEAENLGMLRVGGDAFAADDDELSQGADIPVLRSGYADFFGHGFCHDLFFAVRRPGRTVGKVSGGTGFLCDRVLYLQPPADPPDDGIVIPGSVGDGDEKGLEDEPSCFPVHRPLLRQLFTVHRDAFADIDEKILKISGPLRFSADAFYGAPLVPRRFLALKTIHCFPSFLILKLTEMNRHSAHFPHAGTVSPVIFGRT